MADKPEWTGSPPPEKQPEGIMNEFLAGVFYTIVGFALMSAVAAVTVFMMLEPYFAVGLGGGVGLLLLGGFARVLYKKWGSDDD